ncbi:MAG: hypothetical protein QXZ68_07750, partial [Candidatus Bathyarchaeia archaeon]
ASWRAVHGGAEAYDERLRGKLCFQNRRARSMTIIGRDADYSYTACTILPLLRLPPFNNGLKAKDENCDHILEGWKLKPSV